MAEMETATLQRPRIGAEEVRQAAQILKKYKQGKAHLESRIIDNEQFWKMRHWQQMEKNGQGGNPADPQPTSGWLVNCILSKHADAMDCYPEPTVLPREEGDRMEAGKLTKILPVVLKQNQFKRTYSDAWWYKLKSGCAAYGVFWDAGKLGGLGDIAIRRMDLLNLLGETVLYATENDWQTPTEQRVTGVDESGKPILEEVPVGLPMCRRGWYDHGKYPFVFDVLFPEEGTPCGYGYIDLCKSPQKQIDLMNQAILKNTLAAATPRFFVRADGAVNENEYADWTKPFVHTNGNLGSDSIAPIHTAGLDSVYVAILQSKIAEMKETAGNRDVANGGVASGVTAATAIAALQEAGGKLSRNMIDDGYEAFSDVVTLCIELIRQFYSLPRQFRLLGGEFASYDNAGLQPVAMSDGVEVSYRVPTFDLEISAQQENPYKTMEYNQFALQLFQMGFFRDDMAQQALRCLELMDFKNKDMVMAMLQNGQTQQQEIQRLRGQLLQAAAVVDEAKGTNLAEQLAQKFGAAPRSGKSGGAGWKGEKLSAMERTRRNARQAVSPR